MRGSHVRETLNSHVISRPGYSSSWLAHESLISQPTILSQECSLDIGLIDQDAFNPFIVDLRVKTFSVGGTEGMG